MNYFVYILRTSRDTLYVGQTNDLQKRMREHKEKSRTSAKYLRMFSGFSLIYSEKFVTRGEALKRESELKKWPKRRKEAFVKNMVQCGHGSR